MIRKAILRFHVEKVRDFEDFKIIISNFVNLVEEIHNFLFPRVPYFFLINTILLLTTYLLIYACYDDSS